VVEAISMMPDDEDPVARAAAMMAQAEALNERLRNVRGEWTSPDGSVTVTVGQNAVPTGLTISDDALKLGARKLGQVVMEGFQEAGKRAGDQAKQAVADTIGEPMTPDDILRGLR